MSNPYFNGTSPARTPVLGQPSYGGQPAQNPARQPVLAKPASECDHCGGYIQCQQNITMVISGILEWIPEQGMFAILDEHNGAILAYVRAERDNNDNPVMHPDCSAEYAHDHITNEPCGRGNDDVYCVTCGDKLSGGGD